MFKPSTIAKMMKLAGVKVEFPENERVMIVKKNGEENKIKLDEIEAMVNGS